MVSKGTSIESRRLNEGIIHLHSHGGVFIHAEVRVLGDMTVWGGHTLLEVPPCLWYFKQAQYIHLLTGLATVGITTLVIAVIAAPLGEYMFVHSSPGKVHGLQHYCNGLYQLFSSHGKPRAQRIEINSAALSLSQSIIHQKSI